MPTPIPAHASATAGVPIEIAVIGGGPKAAANAAKAWVLRAQQKADIRITIFEPEHIGAHWSGKSGYTNGNQPLCTIAERDVGYPYNSMDWDDVDLHMASKFSWAQFLNSKMPGYTSDYSTWVDAGRKPPSHKHFAEYLQWVVSSASSQVQVVKQRVIGLGKDRKRWQVEMKDAKGVASTHATRFDAIVVTGPGPAKHLPSRTPIAVLKATGRVFDGRDFWQRAKDVRACVALARKESKFSSDGIVIVGAGGTAAAILAWLIANGARDMPIQMVAGQAALYTRVDSVFENQVFSDEEQWATFSPASRRAFFDRLNRGVVWATVMDRVSAASKFVMTDGRALEIVLPAPDDVQLKILRGDGDGITLNAPMLIDCSGFDAWWFLSLIKYHPGSSTKVEKRRRERWQVKMTESLQLTGAPWDAYPPLHAPMVSSEQGPGFVSLMVLGAMADRVLRPYCPTAGAAATP